MKRQKGDFTLPAEVRYEKLTLELAEKWGADVIRDTDGTELPPETLEELVPGERYLVYGMDYRDKDWILRQFLKEDRGIDMPSSFQEEFLKPFSETELEQWKAGSQFNHYADERYYGDHEVES